MPKERIVRLFDGSWIDLGAIISIKKPYFYDGEGCGSEARVGVEIICDASESRTNSKTKVFVSRGFRKDEKGKFFNPAYGRDEEGLLLMNGRVKTLRWDNRIAEFYLGQHDYNNLIAFHNITKEVEHLVDQWKAYKTSSNTEA